MDDIRQTLYNIFERYKRQKHKIIRDTHHSCAYLLTSTSKRATKAYLCRQLKTTNEHDTHKFVKYSQLSTNQEDNFLDYSDDEVASRTQPTFYKSHSCQRKNGE